MPLELTVVAVTDDEGAVQQYHIAEACGENCNLDDAREAGHVVQVQWPDVFRSVVGRFGAKVDRDLGNTPASVTSDDLRSILCDRAFGLTDGA